ncbi:hypothetical protein [Photorhabdus asymbiotica]|uniref:hypothetical protein n=1 Tax=Photorhabdus asymbiotica TaxID=291112 RepID=UPI003DA731A6
MSALTRLYFKVHILYLRLHRESLCHACCTQATGEGGYITHGYITSQAQLPTQNDQGDIGPTIGTAALATYLVHVFHFLSEHPEALSLKLLTNPGFIYSTSLLLFSLESMKLRRLRQK